MGRFNAYFWAFICCLPLGIIMLLSGFPILQGGAETSGMSLIVLGIIILALSGILLIVGLIKFGQQTI